MDSQPKQLPAPLFYPVLCWCAGIALGKWLNIPGWWALGASAGLIGLALAFRQIRVVCILLICLCLGAARFAVSQRPTLLDAAFASRDRIVNKAEFTVKQQLSRSGGIFEIELRQVQGMRIDEPLLLFSQTELVPGQRYSAYLEILPGKRDPVLDTFRPLHRAYIRKSLRELPGERPLLPIASWRASLLRVLDERMGPDADFAKALTLSDTAGKGQYRDSLTRSGMIHLIVVSGLHIWFIYWVCMMLLNVLFPRPLAEAVFMLLIGLYAALNHWSPPVLRSVLMIGLMIFARWRSIPLSGAQLLALSLLIITAISPAQLFDVGLQLSFLCVGVIMLGLPRRAWIKERDLPSDILRTRLNRGIDYLVMNTAVGLAVMPLTLYYFGTASLNGIIGNILGVPLSGVLLVLCFIVMILPTNNLLGAAYLTSYRLLLRIFEGWTDLVGSLPFYLDNSRLTAVQVLGCGLLLVCLLRMLRLWAFLPRLLPAILLACLLIALPGFLNQTAAGVYLFNAGTADCILIRLEDGSNLLVDTGPKHRSSEKSWAARKLIPWLGRKGVNSLDWLILTHLDSDHSGGFADLCSALTVKKHRDNRRNQGRPPVAGVAGYRSAGRFGTALHRGHRERVDWRRADQVLASRRFLLVGGGQRPFPGLPPGLQRQALSLHGGRAGIGGTAHAGRVSGRAESGLPEGRPSRQQKFQQRGIGARGQPPRGMDHGGGRQPLELPLSRTPPGVPALCQQHPQHSRGNDCGSLAIKTLTGCLWQSIYA